MDDGVYKGLDSVKFKDGLSNAPDNITYNVKFDNNDTVNNNIDKTN